MNKIETIVRNYIVRHGMWKHDGSYIVALSGGADSVALLLILKNLGMPIHAAHCNFHLRGEESERDEQFCVDLCEREGICLHRIHFDTLTYAEKHKVSIEMAARDLRYRYFAQLARDIEADGICVAHHRDDNVETLLLNLLRGSGVDGLAAIAPKNGNILRPLLCISRQDVLDYLAEKGQDYVTDSTNLEDDALRNKIRHHVIPLLETLNPAARENIAQSARYLRQAKMMLDDAVDVPSQPDDSGNTITIGKQLVMQAASPEFMLHQLIGSYGFHGDTIDGIIESMNSQDDGIGKIWKSNEYILCIDREKLLTIMVLFCFSSSGFYGSIASGMGDQSIMLAKAVLDLFTAVIFGCSMGLVVSVLAVPQFFLFMILFCLAKVIYPVTTAGMLNDFKAVGGFLLIATAMRLLKVKDFPVADMVPAMILVMPLSWLWAVCILPML